MDGLLAVAQILGIVLGLPTSLLALHDWRQRTSRGPAVGTWNLPAPNPAPAPLVTRARGGPVPTPPPMPAPTPPPPPVLVRPGPIVSARPVSLPRRILSGLIDSYAWLLAATGIGGLLSGGASLDTDAWTSFDTLGAVIALALYLTLLARTGRSLGRLIVGGRLVPTDDRPLTVVRALVRTALAVLLSPVLLTYLAGLADRDRRTLHDRLTATRVIRTR